jgi:HSP20 family protein
MRCGGVLDGNASDPALGGALTAVTRRERWLDRLDWLEHVTGPLGWRAGTMFGIRIEDETREDSYVLRAELPGIDPDKDVQISVNDGVLTIKAERNEQAAGAGHSEFHYGAFSRSVALPAGADEDHVTAHYADGILEVTVPLAKKDRPEPRRIPVSRAK